MEYQLRFYLILFIIIFIILFQKNLVCFYTFVTHCEIAQQKEQETLNHFLTAGEPNLKSEVMTLFTLFSVQFPADIYIFFLNEKSTYILAIELYELLQACFFYYFRVKPKIYFIFFIYFIYSKKHSFAQF